MYWVSTQYLACVDAPWLSYQHCAITVLCADDAACLFGCACLHSGVHVLGVACLWQTYADRKSLQTTMGGFGEFCGAHLVFISNHMNTTIPHPDVPVLIYDSVLDPDQLKSFLAELSQSHLELHQPYPNRVFSQPLHTAWLRGYFDPLIETAIQDAGTSGEVQQVFMSFEMPDCQFMYHRPHPNIGAVICYSIDDFPGIELDVLTEGFDDPDDYLWSSKERAGRRMPFQANQAIMIRNTKPRNHWGFTANIGAGRVKRDVWIYLGK